jgi:hypothetical protein
VLSGASRQGDSRLPCPEKNRFKSVRASISSPFAMNKARVIRPLLSLIVPGWGDDDLGADLVNRLPFSPASGAPLLGVVNSRTSVR